VLTFNAGHITPVNAGLIPTGRLAPVKGTPFDFTSPHAVGERVNAEDEQMKFGGGYDHNWVLNKKDNSLTEAAVVTGDKSGIVMTVLTTEPAIQFYGGNFFAGKDVGKYGRHIGKREGLALYLDGRNLPAETYQTCDSNYVLAEVKRLTQDESDVLRYWQGPTETAFYVYGDSFEAMKRSIQGLVDTYPLCKGARIVQIA